MAVNALQKILLQIVREKLIPWASNDVSFVSVRPPLIDVSNSKARVTIREYAAPPLPASKQDRSHMSHRAWPEEGLHSMRVPYLGCILEGEADFKTGLTTAQLQLSPGNSQTTASRPAKKTRKIAGDRTDTLGSHPTRWIMSFTEGTFFLFPPNVPQSNSRLHWERPEPEKAHSRIFWLHILPSGVICHTCLSTRGTHTPHPYLFVHDPWLSPIMDLLLNECENHGAHYETVLRLQLTTLLLRLERAMVQGHTSTAVSTDALLLDLNQITEKRTSTFVLQQVQTFLRFHLHEPLSPPMVARQVGVSVSHLNRIFRENVGMSMMQYVTQQRLEMAKSLLSSTDLSITEIGNLCGYPRASHFSQAFALHEGSSPREFRHRHHLTRRA